MLSPLLSAACRRYASASSPSTIPDLVSQASRELQKAITPNLARVLATRGAAVVDGALSSTTCGLLREEFRALQQSSPELLRANCTHFVEPGAAGAVRLLPKRGILEAEATLDPEARQRLPLWRALADDGALRALLSVHLGEALAELHEERRRRRRRRRSEKRTTATTRRPSSTPTPAVPPPLRLENQTVKLQTNDGSGGCFPIHCDATEDLADGQVVDGRVVSCILYLTPSDGYDQKKHGGELRLYPLVPPAASSAVDVAPLEGRMVLFSSARMPHRVLPARGGRVRECATFWLGRGPAAAVAHAQSLDGGGGGGGGGRRGEALPTPPRLPLEEQLDRLLSPRLRPLAARVLLADEWEASLIEAHAPGPERDAAVGRHRRERALARAALAGENRMGLGEALDALAGGGVGGGGGSEATAAAAAAAEMDWF
jgi:hypothetical protein